MSATNDLVAAIWKVSDAMELTAPQRSVVMGAAARAVHIGPLEYQNSDGSQRYQTMPVRQLFHEARAEVKDMHSYASQLNYRRAFDDSAVRMVLAHLGEVWRLLDEQENKHCGRPYSHVAGPTHPQPEDVE